MKYQHQLEDEFNHEMSDTVDRFSLSGGFCRPRESLISNSNSIPSKQFSFSLNCHTDAGIIKCAVSELG